MIASKPGLWARGYASAIAIAAALTLPATALAAVRISSDGRTALPKTVTLVGPTLGTTSITVAMILPSRDPARLQSFIARVSQPGDPLFHHYLTPAEFALRFGASQADYKQLVTWATAHGLTPGEEYSAHTVLTLTGSVKAFQSAFGVTFTDYKDAKGNTFYNAKKSPSVPAWMNGKVTSIIGLNSMDRFVPLVRRLPAGVSPSGAGTGVGGAYAAADLRTAYSVSPAPIGVPREVTAVFEQGGFDPNDVATYLAANGLATVPVVARGVNGYGGGIDDPNVELEAVLDIDMIIGINPAAGKVVVYEDGQDPFPVALVASFAAMASDDKAQTISVSYGVDEAQQASADIQAENTALQQEAAQGQTVFVSAGDQGAYGREGNALNAPDPGSQPLVTSVGGTTLFTGPGEQYLNEITWNELGSRGFATGGGVSAVWPIPTWQVFNGTSVAVANGGSSTNRNVPDIAAVGDPFTGVAVYSALNGGWIQIGGTSVSSPIWAGYASIVNAVSKAFGLGQIGFANPGLYDLGENYFAYNDIVDGNNGDAPLYGIPGFSANYGYDNVSGWGTPSSFTASNWALLPTFGNTNPPPAPNGLKAKPTSASVKLTWSAAAGATGYLVEGINLATFGSTPNLFAVKTNATYGGLTPNTQYEFEVFSVSAGGTTASVPIYITTPGG
jgi:kumamolisin